MAQQTDMSPAEDFYAITPNDGTDLTFCPRALVIAVGGTLKVHKMNGNAETLTVPAGLLPIKVKRVWATGTSATGISGLV